MDQGGAEAEGGQERWGEPEGAVMGQADGNGLENQYSFILLLRIKIIIAIMLTSIMIEMISQYG